ncbi:hypothetical protein MVEN_02022300 [Mycena venus]|uniref:DUF7730 domain-containing protein n=1 Tax=Mycena venus TaxID=2733690 RepID=A0A8H6XCC2_9AGAR|nr:hypothetical protein MVEN_02022300 [Mycena venus]
MPSTVIDGALKLLCIPRIPSMHQRRKQSETLHLLKLPVELRLSIYEHILGRRLIRLELDRSYSELEPRLVSWTCPMPVDGDNLASRRPSRASFPDHISGYPERKPAAGALLLLCRQVFSEALPILHRRSTFHFWASDLEVVLRSLNLGRYYQKSDIRSVYLLYDLTDMSRRVIPLLQQIPHFERLAIEFQFRLPQEKEVDPQSAALRSNWGRDILGFRNLRQLELWFSPAVPWEHSVYRDGKLVQRFRELMIGSGAGEKYRRFIEDSKGVGGAEC